VRTLVGFDVVGRDRRYVVVLNLVAGSPQTPEGRNASRGGGLVNWALMASWIA
jgi:hypothetical protein